MLFKTFISKLTQSKLNINIKDSAIDGVTSITSFGIIIHEYLTWKQHTKLLLNKLKVNNHCKIKKVKPVLTSNHSQYFTRAWFNVTFNIIFHHGALVIKH